MSNHRRALAVLPGLFVAVFGQPAPQRDAPAGSKSGEAEVIQLDRFVVREKNGAASNAYGDKQLAESIAERLSEAALGRATAEVAGDLLKGMAGVSVSSDGDGGSKIAIRGMDSRFNRLTIDGQRQGNVRALDSLPPGIVKSLEVTKALTPDMDADAIGGAINVTTGDAADLKAGYVQGRHQLSVNTSTHRPGWRSSVTVGRPFRLLAGDSGKPDAGFVFGVNFEDQFRWRENIETNGDWPSLLHDGRLTPAYTQARIETTRDEAIRKGVLLNADLHLGEDTALFVRSNYSSDLRRRNRARMFFDVAGGRPLALTPEAGLFSGVQLQQRNSLGERERELLTVSVGGKNQLGRRTIEGHAGYAHAKETDPSIDTTFSSDHVFRVGYDTRPDPYRLALSFTDETVPGDLLARTDSRRYAFDQLVDSDGRGEEEEASARLDLRWDLGSSASSSYVKFGTKLQHRRRSTRTMLTQFDAGATPVSLTGLVGQDPARLSLNDYVIGPTPDARHVAGENARFSFNAVESQFGSASGTFASTETVYSAYGMGRATAGKWTFLGGARVEATRYLADGNRLSLQDDGSIADLAPARATGHYLHVLPGLHVRYAPRARLLVRASVTRALVRPDYRDLSPRQSITTIDRRIAAGNPDLRPYEAVNYDGSLDWYGERAGLVSLGIFHKDIAHFIATTKRLVTLGDRGDFTETRPVNGNVATLRGLEVGWQGPAQAAPILGASFSFELNYTFSQSEARMPDRPGESLPLPEQARHQANVVLRAERGRFTGEVAVRYRTEGLENLVAPGRDVYHEGGFDVEASLACKLGQTARLTVAGVNLSNRPERIYSGDRRHQKEFETAIMTFSVGLQWKL